jgi:hypothetical protein
VTGHAFGRRPPHPDDGAHRRLRLGDFLRTGALPAIPASIDWVSKVPSWPMLRNDELGCCTVSAAGHMVAAWSTYGQGTTVEVTDQDVLDAYQAVSGYVPGDPSTDQGAVMQDVLGYWRKTGVGGHKILAFAQVDVANLAEVYAALYLFGHVYVGVNLPNAAVTQFDKGQPWTVATDDGGEAGGHCINLGWRNGTTMKAITWGRVQGLDEAWWQRYAEEAWVVADQDWITKTGGSPEGLDVQALGAAFTDLTHQPSPFVVPVPGPSPAPIPTPVPVVDDVDRTLAAAVKTWAGARHRGTTRQVAKAIETWLAAKHL